MNKMSMRVLTVFVCLFAFWATPATETMVRGAKTSAAVAAAQNAPVITGASLRNKKLIIEGSNFDAAPVILINGEKQNTKKKIKKVRTVLIAKKGGDQIEQQEPVTLQVQNSDGAMSNTYSFFQGRTISQEDNGKTVELQVGERFQLKLETSDYSWTVTVADPAIVQKIDSAPTVPDSEGLYEAKQKGQTRLDAIGELPCHKSNPPCDVANLGFSVTLVVQ